MSSLKTLDSQGLRQTYARSVCLSADYVPHLCPIESGWIFAVRQRHLNDWTCSDTSHVPYDALDSVLRICIKQDYDGLVRPMRGEQRLLGSGWLLTQERNSMIANSPHIGHALYNHNEGLVSRVVEVVKHELLLHTGACVILGDILMKRRANESGLPTHQLAMLEERNCDAALSHPILRVRFGTKVNPIMIQQVETEVTLADKILNGWMVRWKLGDEGKFAGRRFRPRW
jgi:hypothetical protein